MKKEITSPTFTQIPNIVIDHWMPQLTDTAFRIVITIARQTFGWILDKESGLRKKEDWISYSQLEAKTGRRREAVSNALRELEDQDLIQIRDANGNILKTIEERAGKRLFYHLNIIGSETEPVLDNQFGNRSSVSEHTKETNTKETLYNATHYIKEKSPVSLKEYGNPDINEAIELLRSFTQSIPREQLNRYAVKRLITTRGKERLLNALRFAFANRDDRYCPSISNFLDLEEKWIDLENYARRANAGTRGGVNNKHYDAATELRSGRLDNSIKQTGVPLITG